MYKFYPPVKEIKRFEEKFLLKPELSVSFDCQVPHVLENFNSFYNFKLVEIDADVICKSDTSLAAEAYRISIKSDRIYLYYNDCAGLFFASTTLKQIFRQSKDSLLCVEINDCPDFRVRGFMFDISRNKVAKLETIFSVIDIMADLKMNHFELYVEGFSFGYPSFERYLEEDGYISIAEYQEIEQYCNKRYIDLVANQNGFGHMGEWLKHDEFKDLAVCPEGIYLWGRHRTPTTLDPKDPRSIELIKKLYKDMLPISNSKYFNMNFDEPFELGHGKSKELCEIEGKGNVYIDYTLLAYEEIKKYGKIPLIWADVLNEHIDLLHRLPKDMIFVDWGYDAVYPFSKTLKKLKESGVKFIAAPGTTSWSSFFGRSQDWLENITNACQAISSYQGEGILLTDWGDFGHLQFWPISYLPLVFTGSMSWNNKEGSLFSVKDYVNDFIFKDKKRMLADILFDLGNYYRYYGYGGNGTQGFYNFMWASVAATEKEPVEYFLMKCRYNMLSKDKRKVINAFFDSKLKELKIADLKSTDSKYVIDEIIQTVKIMKMIVLIDVVYDESLPKDERIKAVKKIIKAEKGFINEQKRLWLYRNKKGGLEESLSHLRNFFTFAKISLNHLEKGE